MKNTIFTSFIFAGFLFAQNVMLATETVKTPSVPTLSKIKELNVSREDEETGKSIFTVHILPGKTKKYEKIEFIITYHQDFPFEDSRGRKYHKIHEPATFKYTVKEQKLVEDLDCYINFRVPYSRERLELIYGRFTFHHQYPITIPSITIKAYDDGQVAWQHSVEIDRAYIWDDKKQDLVLNPKQPKKKASSFSNSSK